MSNVPLRRYPKDSFYYLLFPITLTLGFILGSFYNPYLSTETSIKPHIVEDALQQNLAYLVVVILSSPDNFERREAIRKSWLLTDRNNSIRHYFALSAGSLTPKKLTLLKDEHSTYRDLLFLYSFSDSYSKLSEKLREVFKWVDKNCQYKFLLKVDDDSFVRLDTLCDSLAKLPQEKLYWGFFDGQASVKTKGKWKEKKWFLCDRYLPYAKGGGYVLSQDLIHLIVSISDHLSLYQNEDVSLGTWLAPFEIHRLHDVNFDTEFRSRGCMNSYLVTHKQTSSMMMQKYKNLVEERKLCPSEHTIRNSYVYNWDVPPSQCCDRTE